MASIKTRVSELFKRLYVKTPDLKHTQVATMEAFKHGHDADSSRERKGDPFADLPSELFLSILAPLSCREICHLRLQNKHTRDFIDRSEESRSIEIYVRHSARTAEPWSCVPELSRIDLREALRRLVRHYGCLPGRPGYGTVIDAVTERIDDLQNEPISKGALRNSDMVLDALVDLHNVQRLLADDERRGLALDDRLSTVQNALQARLLVISDLEVHVVWPMSR